MIELELVAGPYDFTEGPAYDGAGVLFTDIPNSRIMRFDISSMHTDVWRSDTGEANGLMFDADGRLYACEGGRRAVVRYERADGARIVLADRFEGRRLNSPNDLAIDSAGRIWFTDPRYGDDRSDMELDHESVFRLTPPADKHAPPYKERLARSSTPYEAGARGGSDQPREKAGLQDDSTTPWHIERMTFDTTRPNGILLSPDERTLYVAQSDYGETTLRQLRAYPIRDDGTLGEPRVLHDFGPARGIDGMCMDTEGNVLATCGWARSGPGPRIEVFSPDGEILETIRVPVDMPTNCTFGDPDLRTLYVTASGSLYRARTQRQGRLWYPRPQ